MISFAIIWTTSKKCLPCLMLLGLEAICHDWNLLEVFWLKRYCFRMWTSWWAQKRKDWMWRWRCQTLLALVATTLLSCLHPTSNVASKFQKTWLGGWSAMDRPCIPGFFMLIRLMLCRILARFFFFPGFEQGLQEHQAHVHVYLIPRIWNDYVRCSCFSSAPASWLHGSGLNPI